MSSNNEKKRTSILKKRKSTDDELTEITVTKIQKKTQFSQKNQVKEFRECSEKLTIWGNSYETLALSKSEGSSYNNSSSLTLHKIKDDDIIQNAMPHKILEECEKENIIINPDASSKLEQNMSSTSENENYSSTHNSVELTLFVDSNEQKRMKKYGTENLNITGLALETSVNKVLSPRKMIFNNKSNVSVVIQDKVYLEPSAQENNISFITEPNECYSEHGSSLKNRQINDVRSFNKPSTSTSEVSNKSSRTEPKTISMPVHKQPNSLMFASPLNKKKDSNDDLFKLIVSDTPSKNLCCLGKSCTPTRSERTVVFTTQRPISIARKSINLLEEFEMIEKNKVDNLTSARKTIFHNDSIQTDKNFDRKTIFGPTRMQMNQEELPCIRVEDFDCEKSMETNKYDNKNIQKTRQTIFYNEPIDIEDYTNKKTPAKFMQQKEEDSQKMMIFNDSNISIDIESDQKSNVQSKIFDGIDLMSEIENNNKMSHLSRKTFLANETINTDKKSNRKTIFDSTDMEVSIQAQQSNEDTRKTMVFNGSNEGINDVDINNQSMQIYEIDRRRTYTKEESVKWHNITDKEMMFNKIDDESDPCLNSIETLDQLKWYPQNDSKCMAERVNEKCQKHEECCNKISNLSNDCSVKIFPEIPSEKSMETNEYDNKNVQKTRQTIFHNESIDIEDYTNKMTPTKFMQQKEEDSQKMMIFNDSNVSIDIESDQKSNVQSKIFDGIDLMSEIENNNKMSHLSRKTFLVNETINTDKKSNRKTIFDSTDMEVTIQTQKTNEDARKTMVFNDSNEGNNDVDINNQSMEFYEIHRRKTYTKEESIKWHNITDKEMMFNKIDDESDPCLNSIENLDQLKCVSSEHSAMAIYEHAVEDFVNLTIVESPLNNTFLRPRLSHSNVQKRQSIIPSPVKNFKSMFDNLASTLKRKDTPKPRLEIDDYLEKMKIDQVKIPRYPQNDSKYMTEKVNEKFQKHEEYCNKISKLSNDCSVKIFPEIPSAKLLMKNLIETMEENLINIPKCTVAPVFPEPIDFENLLRNKFDTDERLSEFWNLDTLFWWKRSFKLTHWKMPMFTINFTCQMSNEEVNECTIPIIFKDVTLNLNAEYRIKSNETKRNLLLRHEFKRAINMTNNFTSMCSSSRDLFSFLNLYHEQVMKVVQLVNNFFNILFKYEAIYVQHPQNSIQKVCFFENEKEILNIQILIDDYIENISIKDLYLRGRRFTYQVQPRENVSDSKGLMFIEKILFDTEKFLRINTIQSLINSNLQE